MAAGPTLMGTLTDDMKRVVLEQRLGFHATVCADGTPNLSPKGTTTVYDDDHLLFADIRSPQTIENLTRNPAIEVNVVDPFLRKGYRFKGTASVHRDGEVYERALELLRERDYAAYEDRVRAVVLIRVERAEPVTSPVYDLPGTEEEEVRASYETRYRASRSTLAPPEPPLSGERIVLRPPTEEDVPAVFEACQDREIQRWIPPVPSPYTEDDARAFIAWSNERWQVGDGASFVVVDRKDRLLGTTALGLRLLEPAKIATVGYWLAREARGHGYATEAVRVLTRWASDELGVERLELYTEPANEPSQRVAERAGFTREGILRGHLRTADGRRDSVIFSLLPNDV